MEEIIIGVIGVAVGLVGLFVFISGLIFMLTGSETLGEVVSSRQDDKNRYRHTVRYKVGTDELIREDKMGYSRALENGEKILLTYKKGNPEVFRAVKELRTRTVGSGLLALMGVAFAIRFLML